MLGLSATFLLSVIGGGELLRHVGLGGNTLRDAGIAVLVVAGVAALVPGVAERSSARWRRCRGWGRGRAGDGFWSGLLVGAALGFVYAPCAGPVLAAVASVERGDRQDGRWSRVAYVAGSAVVLAAIALGGRRVLEPIRRAGPLRVQRALGAVLLLTAVAFGAGLDMDFETALARHTERHHADRGAGAVAVDAEAAAATCTTTAPSSRQVAKPTRPGHQEVVAAQPRRGAGVHRHAAWFNTRRCR